PAARRLREAGRRELEGLAGDPLVLGRAVAAAARLGARGRLLLVVAGDEDREGLADPGDDRLAVSAAADRVAEEGEHLRALRARVREARVERGDVPVSAPHGREEARLPCLAHGLDSTNRRPLRTRR